MISAAYLELSIEKRNHKYFVLIVDCSEINEVGPLTRKQALNLHFLLANEAVKSGGRTQPIRKPKIKAAPRKSVPCTYDKPVINYPISDALLHIISR